jgi:dTDP-4-amino-4,6-dideoxy-D-galactose acyltransferase
MHNLVLKKLDWDSEHFGIKIATINSNVLNFNDIDKIIYECELMGFACIYCLVDPNNLNLIRCLSEYKFQFIDIRVLFQLKIDSINTVFEKDLKMASPEELAIISNWAEHFHQDSRFFKDKNFEISKVRKMYNVWVNKFFNSRNGSVLVYKESDELIGYIIVSIESIKKGKIELIGVSENHRGKGYGEKLVNLSIKWFKDRGIEEISVVTQASNISAMRLYSKAKFLPFEIGNWYHYWSLTNV